MIVVNGLVELSELGFRNCMSSGFGLLAGSMYRSSISASGF